MNRREIGIEEARKVLGDLVTAAQQGTEIILTRNRRAVARITAYQEDTVMTLLATVATAGSITDQNKISVDETRDGIVIATPFVKALGGEEIDSGDWNAMLAEVGWTVTTGWDDHDGFWTAEVERS